MLPVNHIVSITHEDGTDEELLCLCDNGEGTFIFDPSWEGADSWLYFSQDQNGIWKVDMEWAVLIQSAERLKELQEEDPEIETIVIGKFNSIDDAVIHYWKNILGC